MHNFQNFSGFCKIFLPLGFMGRTGSNQSFASKDLKDENPFQEELKDGGLLRLFVRNLFIPFCRSKWVSILFLNHPNSSSVYGF